MAAAKTTNHARHAQKTLAAREASMDGPSKEDTVEADGERKVNRAALDRAGNERIEP
jgi:hypothetical protein